MKKIIVGLDGMDRTGKSSLGASRSLKASGVFSDMIGQDFISFNGHENRYSAIAKECFKDTSNGISAAVSKGVAIAELLEGIEHMNSFGYDGLIMPRTFASSIVYMCMRGDYTEAEILMQDVRHILEKFEISYVGFYLEISKETMIERGSKEDSYEIVKYNHVLNAIDYCTKRHRCAFTHLERVDVNNSSIDSTLYEVVTRTRKFIELGGRDMDHDEYAIEYVEGE
uniref:Thymidylate kinase n=1 Tax=Ochrobactrum phage ORM_20 TaxID=2985243 RepID=A0A9N6ZF03_9VIRU|nr:hypothetical protein ORM20_00084 [Ochrobactrum phage ORM_20]